MKEKGPDEGPMAAARQILNYLIEHPDAKDTMEGILRWWLSKGSGEWKIEDVQEALEFLLSRGWIAEREITPKVYGVKKNNLDQIKKFLNGGND